MFSKPVQNKTNLVIGSKKCGEIEFGGKDLLVNTFYEMQEIMLRLRNYDDPRLGPNDPGVNMLFATADRTIALRSEKGILYVVNTRGAEVKTEPITGEDLGLHNKAGLEEQLFKIADDLIKEVREDCEVWADSVCIYRSGEDKSEYEKRKKICREKFLGLTDCLERYTQKAKAECLVPQNVRKHFARKHLLRGFR